MQRLCAAVFWARLQWSCTVWAVFWDRLQWSCMVCWVLNLAALRLYSVWCVPSQATVKKWRTTQAGTEKHHRFAVHLKFQLIFSCSETLNCCQVFITSIYIQLRNWIRLMASVLKSWNLQTKVYRRQFWKLRIKHEGTSRPSTRSTHPLVCRNISPYYICQRAEEAHSHISLLREVLLSFMRAPPNDLIASQTSHPDTSHLGVEISIYDWVRNTKIYLRHVIPV